jgi:hypothetical protein
MRKLGKMKFDALVDAVSAADRRRFITLLGGTAVWPLAARASREAGAMRGTVAAQAFG